MGEQRRSNVDFPPLGLDFDDSAYDKVADFGGVACAERADREKFVGALNGAGYGGKYLGGWGGGDGSVAPSFSMSLWL